MTDQAADKKLNLFIILLNAGLLYFFVTEYYFVTSSVKSCGFFIEQSGVSSAFFMNALIGVTSLTFILFRNRFRAYLFLLQTLLFFAVYRDFVVCQAGPEKIQQASNHAIIFWILLSLTVIDLIKKERLIFLLKFILVMSYFNSVFAKLLYDTNWANGYTLQYYFLERHLMLDLPYALPVIKDHTLAVASSFMVLFFEITSPLSLINRRLEVFYLVFFLLFQIACIFVIELQFMKYYGLAYLIYFADYAVEYVPRLKNK